MSLSFPLSTTILTNAGTHPAHLSFPGFAWLHRFSLKNSNHMPIPDNFMASHVHDDTACSALLAFTATSIRLAHGFQLTLDTPLGSLFQLQSDLS